LLFLVVSSQLLRVLVAITSLRLGLEELLLLDVGNADIDALLEAGSPLLLPRNSRFAFSCSLVATASCSSPYCRYSCGFRETHFAPWLLFVLFVAAVAVAVAAVAVGIN